jgi:predicted aspartyl protease
VPVQIAGKVYHFLLDSGSQTDVIDAGLVTALGLHPEGTIEVSGAKRTAGGGTVETPVLSIGGVPLPMRIATVVDLSQVVRGTRIDGMIGYPLFAAADVRIDPSAQTLTFATPGTLPHLGAQLDVDTDRQLCDVDVTIEGQPVRVLFDTGDANELLIFQSFLEQHPGMFTTVEGNQTRGSGIGGSVSAHEVSVTDLAIGPYRLYNRSAVVVLAERGAFADRNDGANVGYGSLQNFVMTFALASHAVYVKPAAGFDNGRFRVVH